MLDARIRGNLRPRYATRRRRLVMLICLVVTPMVSQTSAATTLLYLVEVDLSAEEIVCCLTPDSRNQIKLTI